jgi:hypothetical protein
MGSCRNGYGEYGVRRVSQTGSAYGPSIDGLGVVGGRRNPVPNPLGIVSRRFGSRGTTHVEYTCAAHSTMTRDFSMSWEMVLFSLDFWCCRSSCGTKVSSCFKFTILTLSLPLKAALLRPVSRVALTGVTLSRHDHDGESLDVGERWLGGFRRPEPMSLFVEVHASRTRIAGGLEGVRMI